MHARFRSRDSCQLATTGQPRFTGTWETTRSILPVTTPPENLTETCRLHNVRDLGVTVDSHVKFDVHMNQIVTRAHRLANLIHKCFASKDPPTLVHAFTSYVRPLLEYASCVWSPYTVGLVNKVESVQRRFTKRNVCCCGLTYFQRLTKLRIESLELRRLHLDLVCVYKILFGMVG